MSEAKPVLWVLRPLGIAGFPPMLDVPDGGITLGRDPNCTIHLDAGQFPQVSAQHARISARDGALEVTPLLPPGVVVAVAATIMVTIKPRMSRYRQQNTSAWR